MAESKLKQLYLLLEKTKQMASYFFVTMEKQVEEMS